MPACGNEASPFASAEATPLPTSASASASAHELLRHMTTGWGLTRGVQVVADLGVADALDDASTPAAETGAHLRALERVLPRGAPDVTSADAFDFPGRGSTEGAPSSRRLRGPWT